MDRTSILNKQVKKTLTFRIVMMLSACFSLLSIQSLAAQSTVGVINAGYSENQETPWKLWKKNDSFNVSYRINSEANLIEVKAQARFNSTLAGFLYFIEDLSLTPQWLDNAKSSELIEEVSTNEHIFNIQFNGIWPFSAREMVVHSRYWQNEDLSIDILVEDAKEISKNQNLVRMQVLSAHWKIKPIVPKQIDITYQFMIDPKGNIPQWLAKPIILRGIWSSLQNMKAQLPKSKYQQDTKANIKEVVKVSD